MRAWKLVAFGLVAVGMVMHRQSLARDSPCQYVGVVNQTVKSLAVLQVGGTSVLNRVGLSGDLWGSYLPEGVDFTTVPHFGETHSFVTQGPYLHIIDIRESFPVKTLHVGELLGLSGVVLKRLDAAEPVMINSELRYPLYVLAGVGDEPRLMILDQEALLADVVDWPAAMLSFGSLCVDGAGCLGTAIDVSTGMPTESQGVQRAFVSVLDSVSGVDWLRIYRVDVHDDFSFDVVLDSWNDEGVPFDGVATRANGLDFDSTGTMPFGVFQSTSVVKNLSDGSSACTLPFDPTDVAVWGPGTWMEHPNFLFATATSADGSDRLLAYPAGQCLDDGPASLKLPISGRPLALALSSDTSASPWIYVASKYGIVWAAQVLLSRDLEDHDQIEVLSAVAIPADGPYELAIRDESYTECSVLVKPKPLPFPEDPCETDPDDPRCVDPVDNDDPRPSHPVLVP